MGVDSLCMLTLGTGVGNGIILGGKIFDGAAGMAGEAGHATIYPDGLKVLCGNDGCLEMYASATAVVRAANQRIASGTRPMLVGKSGRRGHSQRRRSKVMLMPDRSIRMRGTLWASGWRHW